MAIELRYTTIPSADTEIASNFYKRVFGFQPSNKKNLKINDDLVFKFKDCNQFNILHFAFNVDDDTFDKILNNVQNEELSFSNSPFKLNRNKKINFDKSKTLYFRDPNGHVLEVMHNEE